MPKLPLTSMQMQPSKGLPFKVPISSITISERLRKDYGEKEMEDLCDSIERYGLIQPIVINQDNQLIAGGRRLTAAQALGWAEITVVYRETLTQDELHELELEENIQRKDMQWQERVCSIAKIYWMKSSRSKVEGRTWGMRETGAMLNMSVGHVNNAVQIAGLINRNDVDIIACEGITEAIKLIAKREEEAAVRELAFRNSIPSVLSEPLPEPPTPPEGMTPEEQVEHDKWLRETFPWKFESKPAFEVKLSDILLRQKDLSLSVLRSLPDKCVDHCITDPPYGIDMAMLQQANQGIDVSSVAISHDVEDNLKMFVELFPQVFRVMRDRGFFVLWCDTMNWQYLYFLAITTGFKVQRWPVFWFKKHQCMNNAAQFNFTKDVEIAMVCRKENTTMVRSSSTCIIEADGTEARDKYKHPFAKPLPCWFTFIHHLTNEGDTILEPFAGRGSGVCPMIGMNRKVIAIEYDETHFAYLVENVKQEYIAKYPEVRFI